MTPPNWPSRQTTMCLCKYVFFYGMPFWFLFVLLHVGVSPDPAQNNKSINGLGGGINYSAKLAFIPYGNLFKYCCVCVTACHSGF